MSSTPRGGDAAPAPTPRQRQVLALLAEGLPHKVVAARLGTSEETVKLHTQLSKRRLGAHNTAHAVAIAVRGALL